MKSVSDSLTGASLQVTLKGTGGASSESLSRQNEIPVLLMCCGPAAPLSSSPRILASLSKSPPSTRDNTWGYPEASCDQTHG